MPKETSKDDSKLIELLGRKGRAGQQLTAEERLELFDANTRWLDRLQAEELEKNQGRHVTREDRGWTREDLYNDDRGFPRGFPR